MIFVTDFYNAKIGRQIIAVGSLEEVAERATLPIARFGQREVAGSPSFG